jgi:hypothetical protein
MLSASGGESRNENSLKVPTVPFRVRLMFCIYSDVTSMTSDATSVMPDVASVTSDVTSNDVIKDSEKL